MIENEAVWHSETVKPLVNDLFEINFWLLKRNLNQHEAESRISTSNFDRHHGCSIDDREVTIRSENPVLVPRCCIPPRYLSMVHYVHYAIWYRCLLGTRFDRLRSSVQDIKRYLKAMM